MGILDFPAPLYLAVDQALAPALPSVVRLLFWGTVAGVLSMMIYRVLAPRTKIEAAKRRFAAVQRRLWEEEDFARAAPLIGAQFGAALKRVGLALPASLIALLPVMTVAIWLDTAYGHDLDVETAPPTVTVMPEGFEAHLVPVPQGPPRLEVRSHGTALEPIAAFAMTAPVPLVEKRHWWNMLIENPIGYLPADGPVERIVLDLPQREYLSFGPGFLRTWLVPFFAAMILASLACHRLFRSP